MGLYWDVAWDTYELPVEEMRGYQLAPKNATRIAYQGRQMSPTEVLDLLPETARAQIMNAHLLTDGTAYYVVPRRVLMRHPMLGKLHAVRLRDPVGLLDGGSNAGEVGGDVGSRRAEIVQLASAQPMGSTSEAGARFPLLVCGDSQDGVAAAKACLEEYDNPYLRRIRDYFQEVDSYGLFFQERNRTGRRGKSLIYGNTSLAVLANALRRIGANSEDVFYDLGCGVGVPVLGAALMVGQSHGVDLFPAMIDRARLAQRELGVLNASFEVADIRSIDLSAATIVYIAATTFSQALVGAVKRTLRTLRRGARLITVTQSFHGRYVKLIESREYAFSWSGDSHHGSVTFHFHKRV